MATQNDEEIPCSQKRFTYQYIPDNKSNREEDEQDRIGGECSSGRVEKEEQERTNGGKTSKMAWNRECSVLSDFKAPSRVDNFRASSPIRDRNVIMTQRLDSIEFSTRIDCHDRVFRLSRLHVPREVYTRWGTELDLVWQRMCQQCLKNGWRIDSDPSFGPKN